MNETIYTQSASNLLWPNGDYRTPATDPSMLLDSEKAQPVAAGLLNNAVQGAHNTIAEGAAPGVRQLGESGSAAEATLHAKTDQLRETRDEWLEGVRSTVQSNPLVCVAAALALGTLIARITR